MKPKLAIFLSIIILIALQSCTTNSLKSGISGTLQYGEGSCAFDPSFRTYTPYSGYVFFVNSVVKDTASIPILEILSISDSTACTAGKFAVKLEVGTYYLCLREYPVLQEDNLFIVHSNQTTEQNFWIFKCL